MIVIIHQQTFKINPHKLKRFNDSIIIQLGVINMGSGNYRICSVVFALMK